MCVAMHHGQVLLRSYDSIQDQVSIGNGTGIGLGLDCSIVQGPSHLDPLL